MHSERVQRPSIAGRIGALLVAPMMIVTGCGSDESGPSPTALGSLTEWCAALHDSLPALSSPNPDGHILEMGTVDELISKRFKERAVRFDTIDVLSDTELAALPDDKLGVVAVTTKDSANAVVNHIAHEALRLMLAARAGKPLPQISETRPLDPALARRLDGRPRAGAEGSSGEAHATRMRS